MEEIRVEFGMLKEEFNKNNLGIREKMENISTNILVGMSSMGGGPGIGMLPPGADATAVTVPAAPGAVIPSSGGFVGGSESLRSRLTAQETSIRQLLDRISKIEGKFSKKVGEIEERVESRLDRIERKLEESVKEMNQKIEMMQNMQMQGMQQNLQGQQQRNSKTNQGCTGGSSNSSSTPGGGRGMLGSLPLIGGMMGGNNDREIGSMTERTLKKMIEDLIDSKMNEL